MKIKRIEIASFGKFKDFSIDFSHGFNLIFGKNEDGKSTLMAFIALMLYGNAGTSSRTDISSNLRKKYAPWSGEKMSGDMEIEHNGTVYRIHKDFKATSKSDKVVVTDMRSGEKVNLPPGIEVGKYFLGIDCSGFEKSLFVGNSESFAGEENSDIAAKLSNISETGDENISTKQALTRLTKARENLVSKSGKNGMLISVQNRAEALSEKLNYLRETEKRQKILKEEYARTEAELSRLEEDAAKARIAAKASTKQREAKNLKQLADLICDAENQKKNILEKTKGSDAETVTKTGEELLQKVRFAKERFNSVPKDLTTKTVSEEDMNLYFSLTEKRNSLTAAQSHKTDNSAKNNTLFPKAGILLGFVLILSGIIGTFFTPYLLSLAIIGAASVVPSFILLRKQRSKNIANDRYLKDFEEISAKIQKLFESNGLKTAEEFKESYKRGIAANERASLLKQSEAELKSAQDNFNQFLSAFDIPYANGEEFLKTLASLTENYNSTTKNIAALSATYEITEKNPDALKHLAQDMLAAYPLSKDNNINGEQIAEKIREKNSRLLEIKGQIGKEIADLGEVERELFELEAKKEKMQKYCRALDIAIAAMTDATEMMNRTFAPKLRERASEIMESLSDGKYRMVNISKTYEIEVKTGDTGAYRHWQYLSRGTCAQSYLALRIAVCNLLEESGEKVPLILDDVLADYDPNRQICAAKFLEEYAKDDRQVLFFTCHPWLGDTSEIKNLI